MLEKKWWHNSVVYQIYPRSFLQIYAEKNVGKQLLYLVHT